jgi:hypothetical protein
MPSGTGSTSSGGVSDRTFDVGIANSMRDLRAGLAQRHRPFCAIYSTFLQRAYDQVVTTSPSRICRPLRDGPRRGWSAQTAAPMPDRSISPICARFRTSSSWLLPMRSN